MPTQRQHRTRVSRRLTRLYDLVTGDEDARVCKDIPEAACHEQPRNFFAYLLANLLSKIADELASARLVLPWLLAAAGAPVALAGFLVPIREAGVLVPQLAVSAAVRRYPRRRGVWLLGAGLGALTLAAMALVGLLLQGAAAGWAIVGLLGVFSLARGLCSVAAKDVMGKTVSKSRRGALMGWSTSLGGLGVLAVGLLLGIAAARGTPASVFAGLLGGAALLWVLAAAAFAVIREEPGATEGGGNALTVALASLQVLWTDRPFRQFVLSRALLLSVALVVPFYTMLVQTHTGAGMGGLGWLVVASGLGANLSAPVWGYLGDRSSRTVMAVAAAGSGGLALLVWAAIWLDLPVVSSLAFWAVAILLITVLHAGVRLGRKVYLMDLATRTTRATYVAVSNTVIGLIMLAAGSIGLLASHLGLETVVLLLGLLSFVAATYILRLPEVSD